MKKCLAIATLGLLLVSNVWATGGKEGLDEYSIEVEGVTEYPGFFYFGKKSSTTHAQIGEVMMQDFPAVVETAIKERLPLEKFTAALYTAWDEDAETVDVVSAMVLKKSIDPIDGFEVGEVKPGKAVKVTLKGAYDNLVEAWEAAMAYQEENNLEEGGFPFEIYRNDPSKVAPNKLITEIYIPVKE